MYSWAGEDRFQDRRLADLVRGGATSTGAFATWLSSIFGTNAASFTYNGDVTVDGRSLAEFGFRVPREKSDHRVGNKLSSAIVGYDGTFLADPKTFDLVRLTVRDDGLPAELNACDVTTTLDYTSVRLNSSDFLLPRDVRFHVINTNATELENRTVFSGCHEFVGESSLSFGPASESEQVAPKPVSKAVVLPPELPFKLALTRAIDTATAAAGDPLKARLTTPIQAKDGTFLVPKGAAISGRIVEIERLYGPESDSLSVAFKLETIEANGLSQPFDAKLEAVAGPVVKRRKKSVDPLEHYHALVLREGLGSFDQMFDPADQGVGFLEFKRVGKDFVIQAGVEIEGVTAAPK
jgi:hypothetical protein